MTKSKDRIRWSEDRCTVCNKDITTDAFKDTKDGIYCMPCYDKDQARGACDHISAVLYPENGYSTIWQCMDCDLRLVPKDELDTARRFSVAWKKVAKHREKLCQAESSILAGYKEDYAELLREWERLKNCANCKWWTSDYQNCTCKDSEKYAGLSSGNSCCDSWEKSAE